MLWSILLSFSKDQLSKYFLRKGEVHYSVIYIEQFSDKPFLCKSKNVYEILIDYLYPSYTNLEMYYYF